MSEERLSVRLMWAGVALFVVVVAAFFGPAIVQRAFTQAIVPRPVSPRGDLGPDEKSTIALFQKVRRCVVYINTSERVMDFWSRNVFVIPRGTGSGFVWDESGNIVTNMHVIAGASEARVRLNDGRSLSARLVGGNPGQDLAVLRVAASSSLTPVPIGTSLDLQVGQKVFAIGNPFGLDWTLTTGIVSALDRSLPAEDGRSLMEHLIQTDNNFSIWKALPGGKELAVNLENDVGTSQTLVLKISGAGSALPTVTRECPIKDKD